MNCQRSLWASLAAALVLISLDSLEVGAFPPRRAILTPGGGMYYLPAAPYLGGMESAYAPIYPSYSPYVAPFPGYGILPPPFATMPTFGDAAPYRSGKTAADYGYSRNQIDYTPRARPSLYPAVPFQPSAEERVSDLRRVRFEISVPYADAIVWMDDVQTKQTGLNRVFQTPPLEEDRVFTATFKVRWKDKAGELTAPRAKTFEFVAGETVKYPFTE